MQYAWLGLRKTGAANELVYTTCGPFGPRCSLQANVVLAGAPNAVYLRMTMDENAMASFSYSTDNVRFVTAGPSAAIGKGGWVGAQVGLFRVGQQAAPQPSWLDVDYFRVTAP